MTPRSSRSAIAAIVLIGLSAFFHHAKAQTSVDPTYNGVPSTNLSSSSVIRQAAQADGKVLVWGGTFVADGVAKGRLVRLNTDGTVDNTFTYCNCGLDGVSNAAPLPDGKLLVGGSVQLSDRTGSKVIRLNSDGSLDPTFNNPLTLPGVNASMIATIQAVQPDGRFFISRRQSVQGNTAISIYHFNADGSSDAAFTPVLVGSGSLIQPVLSGFEVLPDGRFWVAKSTVSGFGGGEVRRYTATGAADPTWDPPVIDGSPPMSIGGIDSLPDGSLVVVGQFGRVNGIERADIVRLMPAGNVDLGFVTPAAYFYVTGVKALSNGKLLIAAATSFPGPDSLVRLHPDGTPDGTYTSNVVPTGWVVDPVDRVLFGTADNITRLLADGTVDGSFNTDIGLYGRIHTMARQADGKVIVAGEFIKFNGVATTAKFVRTNADGTLDPTYNTGTGFNAIPTKMVAQPDGKLLVIGPFTHYNGAPAPGIVRLMPNGTVDPLFSVVTNGAPINWIELLADGRFYLGGSFSTINGLTRPGVIRLHTDGTPDHGFNALIGGSPNITSVVAQPDGKVLIGGSFTGIGGFNRSGFARVDSSGALDQTFNPTNTSAGQIYLATDGKILTLSILGGGAQAIVRRNSDGSTDSSFTSVTFTYPLSEQLQLDSVLARPEGSIIVGGLFDRVGGTVVRSGIVRLAPNGKLDQLFLPKSTDGRVRTIIDGGDGKVLIGGDFTRIETTSKPGLARLNVTPFRKITPFDFDGDGKADLTVFRPSDSHWYTLQSSNSQFTATYFGAPGDIVCSADFDGDGKTDVAIFRPGVGQWWYGASSGGGQHWGATWGAAGDKPLPSDYDGDGRADFVVYRPSDSMWYRANHVGATSNVHFGAPGDLPLIGDFDGDGKSDPAIFRPSTGIWWYAASGAGGVHTPIRWGAATDVPVPGDYDGDGKTDAAVFRPGTGAWYILRSSDGLFTGTTFGFGTDRPVPADYDGDGNTDIAVFRPSTGAWYLLQSTAGLAGGQWGASTDVAIPNAFVP